MENKTYKCYNCRKFDRFYTVGSKKYNKTQYGWCCKNCDIVNAHNTCDNFEIKPRRKKVSMLVKVSLNNLLTEITEIRKVFEAVNNDEDEM